MMIETQALILCGLTRLRGDDFERASAAFRHCTPAQMQEVVGGDGETRQEILDGYRQHTNAVDAAIAEVTAL
jgi:hypothetical protein